MKTICILNLKGGVAKTTTAACMAQLLANGFKSKGKRICKKYTHGAYRIEPQKVLLFDNDKQGNLSRLFSSYQNDTPKGAANILKTASMKKEIMATDNENINIVPCNYFMELAEMELKNNKDIPQHNRYKIALDELKAYEEPFGFDLYAYDYCIIDNAPDLGINVINALTEADEIIIPVNLDAYSLDGLQELATQINNIMQLNRKAKLAGILITDIEYTDSCKAAEIWLRTKSRLPVFDTVIRHSKKVKDSTFYKKTPIEYSPNCAAALDYKRFVKEYLDRSAKSVNESEVNNNGI